MAAKRKAKAKAGKRKSGRKTQHGKGFFGDLWKGVKSVASKVIPIVKDTGLISKGLALTGNPIASGVAGKLGFGRGKHGNMKLAGMSQ